MVTPIFLNQTTPRIFTKTSNIPPTINQNSYSSSHLEQIMEEHVSDIKQVLYELNEKQDKLKEDNEYAINNLISLMNKLYLSYTLKNNHNSLMLHQISRQIQPLKEGIQEQINQTNHSIIETLKKQVPSDLISIINTKSNENSMTMQEISHQIQQLNESIEEINQTNRFIIETLKKQVPSNLISTIYLDNEPIIVRSLVDLNEKKQLATFILSNGNILVVDMNRITAIEFQNSNSS